MSCRRGELFKVRSAVALLISVYCINGLAGAEGDRSRSLAGLWATEVTISPAVEGELTIERTSVLHAITSGFNVPAEPNIDAPFNVFVFPNGAGELRLGFSNKSLEKLAGFFVQPANEINDNRYATPVELSRVSEKKWRGRIEPLRSRRSLYLSIQQTPDRLLTAVIRNPEANLFGRNIYHVDLSGAAVTFSEAKDPSNKFEGKLDEKAARLSIRLPGFDKEVAFARRKQEKAIGFFPRVPGQEKYVYQKPKTENDGWATASLAEVDLDAKSIAALIDKIVHVDPTNNALNIQSLLIARHGKLVLEEYFYDFEKDRPHDMRSASKTFAPLLLGIARDNGASLVDPDAPVYAQFGGYERFANPDPRKEKMTVRDLMTMTSGLACDVNDDVSPGNENNVQQQKEQPDWYKYTLDLPMSREPGGDEAIYCSAGINLLGDIVGRATREWLPNFFDKYVARPLQIKTYHWNLMPDGEGYLGGGLYLRPRDELKLGQLYLNGGEWNRHRVVSKDWVTKSTSYSIEVRAGVRR